MPLKTQQDDQPTVNLTPMIDIVFLLIIFFMVGTKFSELERNISLSVPQVKDVGALTPAPQRREVSVFEDGRIALDRDDVTLDELTQQLTSARQQYSDLGVLVRGDAGGRYQRVAEVLAACKEAGIGELGISVRIAQREK